MGKYYVSTEASSAANPGPEQTAVEQSSSAQHQDTAANSKAFDVIRWNKLFITHLWGEKENNCIETWHRDFSCLSRLVDPEPAVESSATHPAVAGVAAQLKPSIAVKQITLHQKARTWADRHHVTRNSMQRHNRVRQGIPQSLFHLQQPGRHNLAHWASHTEPHTLSSTHWTSHTEPHTLHYHVLAGSELLRIHRPSFVCQHIHTYLTHCVSHQSTCYLKP